MIDKRIGKRFKEARENLGLTQEELAERTNFSVNYISRIERGASFPRYENLVNLLNVLKVPADAIFCDVVLYSNDYKASQISDMLLKLKPEARQRILKLLELMIKQELEY